MYIYIRTPSFIHTHIHTYTHTCTHTPLYSHGSFSPAYQGQSVDFCKLIFVTLMWADSGRQEQRGHASCQSHAWLTFVTWCNQQAQLTAKWAPRALSILAIPTEVRQGILLEPHKVVGKHGQVVNMKPEALHATSCHLSTRHLVECVAVCQRTSFNKMSSSCHLSTRCLPLSNTNRQVVVCVIDASTHVSHDMPLMTRMSLTTCVATLPEATHVMTRVTPSYHPDALF